MGIVSVASLWRQIWEMIQLECIMDGQWCQMGDYVVLMVKFGIHNTSVTGMPLAQLMRMAHWGPLHMCVMQLIPRATLLSTGFFDEGIVHSKPLKALASHQLGTSCEGHLDWLDGQFALHTLIDAELRDLDDVRVEANIYHLRKAALDKKDLEEQDC